jgi:hypothetical protein
MSGRYILTKGILLRENVVKTIYVTIYVVNIIMSRCKKFRSRTQRTLFGCVTVILNVTLHAL